MKRRTALCWLVIGIVQFSLMVSKPSFGQGDEKPLGLSCSQILKRTDDQWIDYYCKKTHNRGARNLYKAQVIYTNCLEQQNEQDLKPLPLRDRKRFQNLEELLQKRRSHTVHGSRSGYAAADHSLGERYRDADLIRHLIALVRSNHALSHLQSQQMQSQAAKMADHLHSDALTNGDASQTLSKILKLVAPWSVDQKLLILKSLDSD